MVSIPIQDEWSIQVLREPDRAGVLAFLRKEPLLNVYLISRLEEEGFRDGRTLGVFQNRALSAVASLSANIVIAVDPALGEDSRRLAIDLIADRITHRSLPVRAIISDSRLVELLWDRLRRQYEPPTVDRLNQPVCALSAPADTLPTLTRVRLSEPSDLDRLVPACAAMHEEEVGIDPLSRDAVGYRERIRELILRGRSFVWFENGAVAFKTELSAVTDDAVQLMGVWTEPSLRRRGYARRGLSEVCGHLRRTGRVITLFVNDFNAPALELYRSLGFRRIGSNRALIW